MNFLRKFASKLFKLQLSRSRRRSVPALEVILFASTVLSLEFPVKNTASSFVRPENVEDSMEPKEFPCRSLYIFNFHNKL